MIVSEGVLWIKIIPLKTWTVPSLALCSTEALKDLFWLQHVYGEIKKHTLKAAELRGFNGPWLDVFYFRYSLIVPSRPPKHIESIMLDMPHTKLSLQLRSVQ